MMMNVTQSNQEPIKYGSNNGTYLTIHGTSVYYEEYGTGKPLILSIGSTTINRFRTKIGRDT